MSFRMERINRELERCLSGLVREMGDRRISESLISISGVKTSPDLSSSKVSVLFLPEDDARSKEILDALNLSKGYIRKELAGMMEIRRIPDLVFVKDKTEERAFRVDQLLEQIRTEGK